MKAQRRAGLTLVELLIVLAILAIMTTMAVTATQTVIDQSRFDATQRVFQSVQDAVLGPQNSRQPDGTLHVSGFVADVGRPPLDIQELWQNSLGIPPLAVYATDDPEVKLLCGWRPGGYIRLPQRLDGTPDVLRDGWGNIPEPIYLPANPKYLSGISSLGADNSVGGPLFDADIAHSIDLSQSTGTVTGTVTLLNDEGSPRDTDPIDLDPINTPLMNPKVRVMVFEPPLVWPTTPPLTLAGKPAQMVRLGSGVYQFTVATSVGSRVLRAYEGTPATKKSRIVSIVVTPGPRSQPFTIQP